MHLKYAKFSPATYLLSKRRAKATSVSTIAFYYRSFFRSSFRITSASLSSIRFRNLGRERVTWLSPGGCG